MTRTVAVLSLSLSLALAAPSAAMVGGAPVAEEALTRHVVMIVGGRSGCTGTAIARDLVLTAAHCVVPGARQSVIEPGDLRRGKRNRVVSAEHHPKFDLETGLARRDTADVALLKLAEPLSAKVAPAQLGARDYFPNGELFTVAGYGITSEREQGFGTLRSAVLMVMRHPASGQIRFADPVTRGESSGLGACSGDSGGPVFEAIGGSLALVGVVSWATDANRHAGCGGLTGATPLVHVRAWIAEAAAKMGTSIAP